MLVSRTGPSVPGLFCFLGLKLTVYRELPSHWAARRCYGMNKPKIYDRKVEGGRIPKTLTSMTAKTCRLWFITLDDQS